MGSIMREPAVGAGRKWSAMEQPPFTVGDLQQLQLSTTVGTLRSDGAMRYGSIRGVPSQYVQP